MKELLLLAKKGEDFAINRIIDMYKPLLCKESIVNGKFDNDLYQELILTLLNCIKNFRFELQ